MRMKKIAVFQLCLWAFAGTVVMVTGKTTRLTYGVLWLSLMLEYFLQLVLALDMERRLERGRRGEHDGA